MNPTARRILALVACGSVAAAVLRPAAPSDNLEITTEPWVGLSEIDGVLCTDNNSYECIGLAEESQAAPRPSG